MKNERAFTHSFRALALAAATGTLVFTMAGCNGCNSASATQAPIVGQNAANLNGADPADQNFATGGQPTAVLGQTASYNTQQSSESFGPGQQAPAPIVQGGSYAQDQDYAYNQGDDDGQYVEAASAPPPLPEYDQPEAPDQNDLWTPGYWAYSNGGGYYWVPGAWVAAPYYGALWTPPYWGWYGGHYRFHHGYWGPHVGFYGGINYGFGYIGTGYFGGYWRGNDFYYNRYANRVPGGWGGRVYERPVIYNNVRYDMRSNNRVSFNGGRGGINVRPRAFEVAAGRERHEAPVAAQMQMHQAAQQNRGQFFNQNHGRPAEFANARPVGNAREIRPTPAGIQTGRGGFGGNATGARPGQPENHPGVQPGQPQQRGLMGGQENRPGQPGVQPGQAQQGFRGQENRTVQQGVNPSNQPQHNNMTPQNNVRVNRNMEMQERGGNNTPQQHAVPNAQPGQAQHMNGGNPPHSNPVQAPVQQQQRFGGNNAGQMHTTHTQPQEIHEAPAARQQPQQRMEQPHMQQQPQHVEAPHAAPAPAQHMEAPHAAPAPHAEAPHAAPAGGGGGHPGGGGGGGHEGHR